MGKNQKTGRRQSVQFLFMMVLFFAMSICALFTILLGAQVYQNITDRMEQNFVGTTALSYISNKVKQGDEAGMVSVVTIEGTSVLKINQIYGEDIYSTLIYYRDGQIKELFSKEDSGLTLDDGMDIMKSEGIHFKLLKKNLLEVETDGKNSGSMILTLRSGEV
ncbi:DUF4860 domain-containing protein [Clostridium aminobutyricum]|uniref:DUF4860 domain-containing protein n=1 Tax=Clostridium aminobutyricum TaxID=33953 RepID=A0A939D9T5_CLOAM|nr:DUF4860 domain-containing protein [Clostridium aminobutyricum]MBN7773393.1 DUF4860 domain-containing protein [Clostridium aminobutyricum]